MKVICINARPHTHPAAPRLVRGRVYIVVEERRRNRHGKPGLWYVLAGVDPWFKWGHKRFRPITKADDEFISQIKALRQEQDNDCYV